PQQLSDLSKSPGDLRDAIFRKYVNERYEHERRKPHAKLPFTVEEMYEGLGGLAMGGAARYGEQGIGVVSKIEGEYAEWFELSIDQACTLHLLVKVDDCSLRFIHWRLRDHFAVGTAVASLGDNDKDVRERAVTALGKI